MKISIIIPAYNEARLLPACLAALREALAANQHSGLATELIVVDNNSTDATPELASAAGAVVVFEPVNQIARARNAGAAAAGGDWLLFLDADCFISAELVADIFTLIGSESAVGCGSTVTMSGIPWWARILLQAWTGVSILCRWAAGSLIVCRADAFSEIGGFSQNLYAAEEIDLSRRLKKWGRARGLRFAILRAHPLITSNRKLELYSAGEVLGQLGRLILSPWRSLREKKRLSMWYDGRR